jgi:hypothetical protein
MDTPLGVIIAGAPVAAAVAGAFFCTALSDYQIAAGTDTSGNPMVLEPGR